MAKGYSARRGFSNGSGAAMKQAAMQQQLAKMQEELEKKQQEVEAQSFTASAGGGAVRATVNGKRELTALAIAPDAVEPDDVELLQDTIISAVNEALRQAEAAMNSGMSALTGSFGLGGLGL